VPDGSHDHVAVPCRRLSVAVVLRRRRRRRPTYDRCGPDVLGKRNTRPDRIRGAVLPKSRRRAIEREPDARGVHNGR